MKTHLIILLLLFGQAVSAQNRQANVQLEEAAVLLDHSPDSSFALVKMAMRIGELSQNDTILAKGNHLLGKLFYRQGAFSQALLHYQQALEIAEKMGNQRWQTELHNAMGDTYYYARQIGLAELELQRALLLSKEIGDPYLEAKALTQMGHLLEKRNQGDSALHYHYQALEILKQPIDSALHADIYENIGSIYEDQLELSKANYWFQRSMRINKSLQRNEELAVNLNNLGDVNRKSGEFVQALNYSNQALALSKRIASPYQQRSAYRDLSKLYQDRGDILMSKLYLDSAYEITERIYAEEGAQQIALLGSFYEIERKEKEIQLLEKGARIDSLRRWILLVFVGLVLVIVLGQWQKIKTNKRFMEKQNRVMEMEQAMLQMEIDNIKLREQQLESEINNRALQEQFLKRELELLGQTLSGHTLQLIAKNKMLEDIQQSLLEALKAEGVEKNKLLKATTKSIELNFKKDEDWKQFEHFFSQVHGSFYDGLKRILPDISAGEQRLCALLKLNIESKEIARVLGITPDSLRIARYRLRKRLGLEGDQSLSQFLGELG
jgi:tetratricopeptide (TPR) repeat protein